MNIYIYIYIQANKQTSSEGELLGERVNETSNKNKIMDVQTNRHTLAQWIKDANIAEDSTRKNVH